MNEGSQLHNKVTEQYALDQAAVQRAANKSASSYATHAAVSDIIADNLLERMTVLKLQPRRILDLGCGTGRQYQKLSKLFPQATVFGADISQDRLLVARNASRFWQRRQPLVCLDAARQLPFTDEAFDLIFCNVLLPWIFPADELAQEINRLLGADGAFFISTAGPDTLTELRSAWQVIDTAEHINAFLDMHDVGDMLLRAGLADPVMDTERMTVEFSTVANLLDELIATGCTTALCGRRAGLYGRDIRRRIESCYPRADGESDHPISATLEIVYAHGWKGQPKKAANTQGSEHYFNLDQLRRHRG